jgi:hypothetical protein
MNVVGSPQGVRSAVRGELRGPMTETGGDMGSMSPPVRQIFFLGDLRLLKKAEFQGRRVE